MPRRAAAVVAYKYFIALSDGVVLPVLQLLFVVLLLFANSYTFERR
jgi:hypothetical protein